MNKHFQLSLDDLKKELLTMGAMVENAIQQGISVIHDRRPDIAKTLIAEDDVVDKLEVKIEEECLKILALYHPVAEDLRFVTTVMKINNDLERIGDLAVNLAKRGKALAEAPPLNIPPQLKPMADAIMKMLRHSLNAFVERDSILARKVCLADDEVDAFHKTILTELTRAMKESPDKIELMVQLLWTSRNLERMADHVTNIAEDVVYMVEGAIIRHSAWDMPDGKRQANRFVIKDNN